MERVIFFPECFEEVVERLRAADWFVHNFEITDDQMIYDPRGYIHFSESTGASFQVNTDLNVVRYAIECVKNERANEDRLNACAFLLFCRWANFKINPSIAVYERVDYGYGHLEKALDDLAMLRALDNVNEGLLVDYLLGNSMALKQLRPWGINREYYGAELTKFSRLIDWDSEYLLVISAIRIKLDEKIEAKQKFECYLEWVMLEYRLSLPAVIFGALLLGRVNTKLMKVKIDQTSEEKFSAARNSTWDIFHARRYLDRWVSSTDQVEEIFVTQDRGLRELLRLLIAVQTDGLSALDRYLWPSGLSALKTAWDEKDIRVGRKYYSEDWTVEYRTQLISEIEGDLGICRAV